MPGFVKNLKKMKKKWATAKEAAGKQTEAASDGYWELANYIFHKMRTKLSRMRSLLIFTKQNCIRLFQLGLSAFCKTSKE